MNPIFMANINVVANLEKKEEKLKPSKIHEGTHSHRIIEYLFENGKTSGSDLIEKLSLKNSPGAYIIYHIKEAKVIKERINHHKSMYSINPELGRNDFKWV